MADRQVGFNEEGARRIAKAVIRSERQKRRVKGDIGRHASIPERGRWAKITENGQDGKYSWVAVKKDESGDWQEDQDWGKGDYRNSTGYAMEVTHKSKWVLKDSIVRLRPTPGQDFFTFKYSPGVWLAKIVSAGSISARSGSQAGSGSVTVQESSDSGSITDKEDVTAYNFSTSEITGEEGSDSELFLEIEFGTGGLWWVTAVDCPAEEEETGGS